MSMIVVLGEFDIHPDDSSKAAELMRVMMLATQKEAGCHHYAYSQDLAEPHRFQLSELWENDESLAAHFQASHMATYRAAMRDVRVEKRTVTRYYAADPQSL